MREELIALFELLNEEQREFVISFIKHFFNILL